MSLTAPARRTPGRVDASRRAPVPIVPVLFTVTVLLGAGLLFMVQPMIAKMLLPAFGGSATVWSTSSLFFQVVLLLAYLYTHLTTTRLGHRWQPAAHLAMLAVPLLMLPVTLPRNDAPSGSPVLSVLATLTVVVGVPFAVLATTGPLIQRWLSWTGASGSQDPYFLFAASNLGSFAGLLLYPFAVEPHLSLSAQRLAWSVGCVVFLALASACAVVTIRSAGSPRGPSAPAERSPRPGRAALLKWTGLAFLPSALMLAVTSHLSTDVAAIPLLWVVPLAIYLATFVLAFGRRSRAFPATAGRLATGAAVLAAVGWVGRSLVPVGVSIAMDLALLALTAYAAHARLACSRPAPGQLTVFYLAVSVGGALGGLLNGVVAPLVFDRVLEYPLLLACVPALLIGVRRPTGRWLERFHPALGNAVVMTATMAAVLVLSDIASRSGVVLVAALVAAAALGALLALRPLLLTVALVVALASGVVAGQVGVEEQTRSFYGTSTVIESDGLRSLRHGTTIHGAQFTDERGRLPITYYSTDGPVGDVFGLDGAGGGFDRVGVVGLGAGSIAAFGRPGQTMRFHEIDPEMARIAREHFTYLEESRAEVDVVLGDGRLTLAREPRDSLDLLVLDAFSSDSIPVHLLTREAMEEYADVLTSSGVLLVHVSNRVFDLEPVLARAADDLGRTALLGTSTPTTDDDGSSPSAWIVITSDETVLDGLVALGWRGLGEEQVTWTDDYSSLLAVLR